MQIIALIALILIIYKPVTTIVSEAIQSFNDWRDDEKRRYQDRIKNDVEEKERLILFKKERENQLLIEKQKATEKYKELRTEIERMPKYSSWKRAVLEKIGEKCEICGSINNLEIHHRKSFGSIVRMYKIDTIIKAFECDLLWDINNGSVLCKECHEKTESSQYRAMKVR